jgi:TonB family protein
MPQMTVDPQTELKTSTVNPALQSDDDNVLDRLLLKEPSFFESLSKNIKDLINPPKLPPLELTSKPVPVRDLWGFYGGNEGTAGFTSLVAHGLLLALVIVIGTSETVQKAVKEKVTLFTPVDIGAYKPKLPQKAQDMGGGGGGGDRSPTPPSRGNLPKPAPKQFVPPTVHRQDDPKLPVPDSIVAPPDAIPQIASNNIGDPLSKFGIPSNGPGSGGGIGTGSGGGVGPGRGPGYGPGSGGGTGGGAYRIGGGVSAPAIVYKVEPEYSEEARKAKFQGTVVLAIVVDEKGNPRDIRVIRPLGLGLDQKAIEAVEKWRFRPGQKDGRAVPVQATIEVNFRLL